MHRNTAGNLAQDLDNLQREIERSQHLSKQFNTFCAKRTNCPQLPGQLPDRIKCPIQLHLPIRRDHVL